MKNFKTWCGFIALAVLSVSLWVSCDFDYGEIKNNSQYTVYFKQKSDNKYHSLNSGRSYELGANEDSYPLDYYSNPARVSYRVIDFDNGEFFDTPPIPLDIRNLLSDPVSITAAGCMDVPIIENIAAGGSDTTHFIYTLTPVFSAFLSTTEHPVRTTWEYKNNKIYVTIQN
jgi:hypothetical protein